MNELLKLANSNQDIILGGSQYINTETSHKTEFAFVIAAPSTKTKQLIKLSFLPHGLAVDPLNPNRVIVCEKIGPGAAEIDLETMELIRYIKPSGGHWFYGHCDFSADGKTIYATETNNTNGEGKITERDSKSFDIKGEFPSFGSSPHECKIIDNELMVITNGGGDPSGSIPNVAYVDIKTRELVHSEKLTNRLINTGHFYISENNDLVVISAPRLGVRSKLGGVSIKPKDKAIKTISSPKKLMEKMLGEALSVAVQKNVALVTHPDANMITFWDTTSRKFIKEIPINAPRGATLSKDGESFIVSFGSEANIIYIPFKSLEPFRPSLFRASFMTGSHLYNWSRITENLAT